MTDGANFVSANTCLIAYEDIPTQEEDTEMHATLTTPHLVVCKRSAHGTSVTSPQSEQAAKAIITVTGCLNIAF
jgi:hypothetical protein